MTALRICALTERRADYSRLKAVLQRMMDAPSIDLQLIVTGQHLVPSLGNTVEDIERDGFPIFAKIPVYQGEVDSGAEMSRVLSRALAGITDALEQMEPDLVFVSVDLGCHLAGAIAGAHMNIPVAHFDGGQVTGSIDEFLRHATTKFSHIHFVCSELSAKRVIAMGEEERYVFNVGDPALDIILNAPRMDTKQLAREVGCDSGGNLILIVQHTVTTEADQAADQVMTTLEAVKRFDGPAVIVYPNIDAGGRRIIEAIENSNIKRIPHVPFEQFVGLMDLASVMVGNSSAGLREAPSFGLPTVNIGIRQQGRERGANVIDVDHDVVEIEQAIRTGLYDLGFRQRVRSTPNPYGDGHSSGRIVEILQKLDLRAPTLIQKKLTY